MIGSRQLGALASLLIFTFVSPAAFASAAERIKATVSRAQNYSAVKDAIIRIKTYVSESERSDVDQYFAPIRNEKMPRIRAVGDRIEILYRGRAENFFVQDWEGSQFRLRGRSIDLSQNRTFKERVRDIEERLMESAAQIPVWYWPFHSQTAHAQPNPSPSPGQGQWTIGGLPGLVIGIFALLSEQQTTERPNSPPPSNAPAASGTNPRSQPPEQRPNIIR